MYVGLLVVLYTMATQRMRGVEADLQLRLVTIDDLCFREMASDDGLAALVGFLKHKHLH